MNASRTAAMISRIRSAVGSADRAAIAATHTTAGPARCLNAKINALSSRAQLYSVLRASPVWPRQLKHAHDLVRWFTDMLAKRDASALPGSTGSPTADCHPCQSPTSGSRSAQ
ncbi:hypothetical protein [Streptomyces sp. NBC_01314]|uniref:hypothetical protein n=1 Tax=Streptomyces sp. NBC_01314 TaxID=2903821 RepID=UPI00308D18DC|nr:hypothetical protein OG622_48455 [Streptomyces sp. NBC_01314]